MFIDEKTAQCYALILVFETLFLDENLDSRHCETLEEVFRRVQFRTIDLEATKLEEEVCTRKIV